MGNIFIDGGGDCAVVKYDGEAAIASPNNLAGAGSGGSYCVRLRDNSGGASSAYTNLMSVAGYKSLRLEFDFYVDSFENREDFFVEWSAGGNIWNVEQRWIAGTTLEQNQWKRAMVVFDGWAAAGRPSSIAIRIRADASDNGDILYFDNTIFIGIVGTVPDASTQDVSVPDRTVAADDWKDRYSEKKSILKKVNQPKAEKRSRHSKPL
jgi:hypothetical protein